MDLIDELKKNHAIILNSQQKKAVMTIDGATLLLAVPGSGKTTVLIARIGNMIYNHGILPSQILTLTFSTAAARDMRRRFSDIFGNEYVGLLHFRTIHSFCYNVIKNYENMMNTRAFKIIDNNSRIIKQLIIGMYNDYLGDESVSEIVRKIGYCKNMMYSREKIENVQITEYDFVKIYNEYENYKHQNRLMDYDDMLVFAYTILKKYPNMLEYYRSKFKYINVDEAQDTSYIQHKIIELVVGKNNNIFMVGDEDQSIYGFRAAFPQALLDFKKTYQNSEILLMERNYRSTNKIVDAADRFIKQNRNRYSKNMYSEENDGEDIKFIEFDEINKQYEYLCDIAENAQDGTTTAVLYRNNESAIPLADRLEERGIPFYIRENTPMFFSHFIVEDIRSFIRLAIDSSDIAAFERVYYKFNVGISRKMFEFVRKNLNGNVFDTLRRYPNIPEYLDEKIIQIKLILQKFVKLTPIKVIESIENELRYAENLKNLESSGYSKENLIQKINVLKSIAEKRSTIEDFLTRIDNLEKIMINSANNKGNIILSTIHSAKGLEFDRVIIIDVISGQFPSQESIRLIDKENDRSVYEEEVRLFYVGITRAKKHLEFLNVKSVYGRKLLMSRFLRYLMYKPQRNSEESVKVICIPSYDDMQVKKMIKEYVQGTAIVHKKYGEGVIKEINADIAIVDFRGENRKLSLSVCVKNEIIYKNNCNQTQK